ncbi:MAG: D-alanyl-D-alanine carboxypeptidase [Sphingobacteriales bacterium JAD_PAG50586_3]|nr:MAG: D-alanyl-D-alanine carboxypeptidase [Sphingobacteriales bacterium JAD_PAG50586_3]
MKFIKTPYIVVFLLLFCSAVYSQNPAQVRKLKTELVKITGSKEFKTATIGVCIMDVETGKVLVETNSEKSLIPASTIKLITTGAGLALLGDTFKFKTKMQYVGLVKNGILNGDINIEGFGDPTTGSERWPETNIDSICNFFVQQIKALGIKKINGQIGASYFAKYFPDNIPPGYEVGDLPTSYGVPLFELNYRENYFDDGIDTIQMPDLYDPDILHDTIVIGKYFPFKNNGTANPKKPEDLFIERLIVDLKKQGLK